ncbi:MAG: Unknown protein [uncultured Thiotrichaceae bacterium]|uniref:Probable oxaloacetate decarboxylase gamma chain n=1 Tax=uncultured Thiotrichaceae bacterium TaxID=298394 RepID=A0A6S6UA73_9GAMM|nr:MAG: Unknown protein [uncultured Thiotrichaceae bacterium]
MSGPLVEQGFDLMLYGMGTVVVFLSLLVVATWAMSTVINRWFPDKPVEQALKPSTSIPPQVPEKTLRIIKDAIAQHRQR